MLVVWVVHGNSGTSGDRLRYYNSDGHCDAQQVTGENTVAKE